MNLGGLTSMNATSVSREERIAAPRVSPAVGKRARELGLARTKERRPWSEAEQKRGGVFFCAAAPTGAYSAITSFR